MWKVFLLEKLKASTYVMESMKNFYVYKWRFPMGKKLNYYFLFLVQPPVNIKYPFGTHTGCY